MRIVRWAILLGVALFALSAAAQGPSPSPSCLPRSLPVRDEAAQLRQFEQFRARVRAALEKRDLAFLRQVVSPQIAGGDPVQQGSAKFFRAWELDGKGAAKSRLWGELERALGEGGVFANAQKDTFLFPFVAAAWPKQCDAALVQALALPKVELRRAPRDDAPLVRELAYPLVELLEVEGMPPGWGKVRVAPAVEGYVRVKGLQIPRDYHGTFSKDGERWLLTRFHAGTCSS